MPPKLEMHVRPVDRVITPSALERQLAMRVRVNALIFVAGEHVGHALKMLGCDREAVEFRKCGEPLRLGEVKPQSTLVLEDVDSLSADDQRMLTAWLDRRRDVQILSTSAKSLWPAVEAGGFLETLYYRLNTVCFDLRTSSSESAARGWSLSN